MLIGLIVLMKGYFIVVEFFIYEGFLKISGSIGGLLVIVFFLLEDEDFSFKIFFFNGFGNDMFFLYLSNSCFVFVIFL